MTTVDPILGRTKDTGKPALVNYYNLTMGGTDIMDQYMANKSVRWKTDRWTMSALAFILDTSVVNATTLFGLKYGVKKPDTRGFRFQLIHNLVKPHILRRMSWPGIQTRIKQKAKDYLGKYNLILSINLKDQSKPPEKRYTQGFFVWQICDKFANFWLLLLLTSFILLFLFPFTFFDNSDF